MKTVKFYTLGCKVNQYETQEMREKFLRSGFKESSNGKRADICVINTCTVTHTADYKSRYYIRLALRQNPKAKIIVTGCYAELDGKAIRKIKGVDHIVKNKDKNRILRILNAHNEHNAINGITDFNSHARAFLKIQDGCNNFCSYCKVPLVRGSSRSKKLIEIAKEARSLVENGFKEIVLTGICLGSYGRDLKPGMSLADVIKELEKISGLLRIRLSSIELKDITDGLVTLLSKSNKLCPHLHIPLQSGDKDVLKRMNRRYSPDDFTSLISRIRYRVPGIAITTDCLVGFPGETVENFLNTVKAIEKIKPLNAHIFPYSERKGTAAFTCQGRISPLEMRKRIELLKKTVSACSKVYQKQFLGQKMSVLIEESADEGKGLWLGHTANYLKVAVRSKKSLKNKVILVKLKEIEGNYILGEE